MTDRQTDGWTDRRADRQMAGGQTGRWQANGQRDNMLEQPRTDCSRFCIDEASLVLTGWFGLTSLIDFKKTSPHTICE